MTNFLSPEISVVEVKRSLVVARAISPNTLAILGSAEQGPVNRPLLCTSLDETTAIYGLDDGGPLYQSIVGFFQNGGERIVVNRCAHYDDISDEDTLTCESASLALMTAGEAATAAHKVSNTGPWDFSLANGVAQPPTLSVSIGGNPDDDLVIACTPSVLTAAGDFVGAATIGTTASFRVNGVVVLYTTPNPAPATKEALALDITAQLPGVYGGLATNKVKITTDEKGSAADVDYVSSTGDFGVQSGFGPGPTAGVNAGPNEVAKHSEVHAAELEPLIETAWASGGGVEVTVTGEAFAVDTVNLGATASISAVTGSGMDMENNPLVFTEVGLVTGADAGEPSINTFDAVATSEGEHGNGLAISTVRVDKIVCKVTEDLLVADGPFESAKVDSVAQLRKGLQFSALDTVNSGMLRAVVKRIVGLQVFFETAVTPTADIQAANLPKVYKETFNLTVVVDGKASKSKTYTDLSMSPLDTKYFAYVIGIDPKLMNPLLRVYVVDKTVGYSNTLDPRPSNITLQSLSGGIDSDPLTNADLIGLSATRTGLHALDANTDFSLLCIPGYENAEVHKAIQDYAETRKTHLALEDVPPGMSPAEIVTYKNVTAGIFSTFVVMQAGRIRVRRISNDQVEEWPNVAYVAGMFARTDRDYNVSEPPAGDKKGRLRGVIDIADNNEYEDQSKRDIVYPEGVNVIFSSSVGPIYFGQTLTDNLGDINVIGVRRAFLTLGKTINRLAQFVLFEKNTVYLRANFVSTVAGYLREQWRKGVLDGETEEVAFVVECDSKNNPPSLIAAQGFYAKVQLHILPGISYGQVELSKLSNTLLND